MKKLAQGFNPAAQDSNPDSRSRESKALTLNHWVDGPTCLIARGVSVWLAGFGVSKSDMCILLSSITFLL